MKAKSPSAHSCLHRTVALLAEQVASKLPQHRRNLNEGLFVDVAYYLRRRFAGRMEESAVCAMLEEALQKLMQRLEAPAETIEAPERYYRMVIKNMAADRLREELQRERFRVTETGIDALAEQGVPEKLLTRLEPLISAHPMALRTLQDKINDIFARTSVSGLAARRYRLAILQAFRFRMHSEQDIEQLPSEPEGADSDSDSESREALHECLAQLPQKERDLIKLRYGMFAGMDGFQYSFEDLQEIFQFRSEQQVRNRFYYVLKQLRDCLSGKGYHRGAEK